MDMSKPRNIIKFNQRNAIKKAVLKAKLHKPKPKVRIISEESDIKEKPQFDWKLEKNFLDAWLEQLELDQFNMYTQLNVAEKKNYAESMSMVTEDDDGKYVWISIGDKLRYVVKKFTCEIFEVNGITVNKKKCYGFLRYWDQWDWSRYYPFKKEFTYE
jgi:hypothetical protein